MVDQVGAGTHEARVKSDLPIRGLRAANFEGPNFAEDGSFVEYATAIEPHEPIKTMCKRKSAHLRDLVEISDGNLQILPKLRCSACVGGFGDGVLAGEIVLAISASK